MITDKLELGGSDVVAIGSQTGLGKTRTLIATAQEYIDADKCVAVISDDKPEVWYKRLRTPSEADLGTINFFRYDDKKTLNEMVWDRSFDVLIVDALVSNQRDLLKEMKVYAITNNCVTFTSFQEQRGLKNTPVEIKSNQVADHIISIKRTNPFVWYMRLAYYFLPFWFKEPNRTLQVLKSRRGKLQSYDITLDFAQKA